MDENKLPQDNNERSELAIFFEMFPLPEQHKNKVELALKLKNQKRSFLNKDSKEKIEKNWETLTNFAKKIKNKYKDASNYWTYNLLIGSSANKEKTPKEFDLSGEDSIEKFLELQELSSRLDD